MGMIRPLREHSLEPGFQEFIKSVGRYPILTAEEERALLTLAKAGNAQARDRLCNHNLRFVLKVAGRFQGAGLPLMDMVNEGAQGLLKAIDRYDMGESYRFLSYAVWWIRQAITHALDNKARVVRLSAEHEAEIRRHRKARIRQVIGGEYEEDPDAQARLNPDILRACLVAARGPISLDQPSVEDGPTQADFLASPAPRPDQEAEANDTRRHLARLVARLPPRLCYVVTKLYGLESGSPMTLAEVGALVGLTRERVRQMKNEALGKMREMERRSLREGANKPPNGASSRPLSPRSGTSSP